MQRTAFGRTGLDISVLGYGCGTVGGLMIRGSAQDRERAVARSVELGINYFDTAALYGNGISEEHLGAVWRTLKPEAFIGTKFSTAMEADRPTAAGCLNASLGRLDMDNVDLFQLHNPISYQSEPGTLTPDFVINEVVPEMQALRLSPTTLPGNPSRAQLVERYARKSGRSVDNAVFYYVYGLFKLAVIIQQIYYRYKAGHTKDPRFAGLIHAVRGCGLMAEQAIAKGQVDRLFG